MTNLNVNKLKEMIEENLSKMYGIFLSDANVDQIYKACAVTVNDILRFKRRKFNTQVKELQTKRVYYLSMEFLIGRSLKNNLFNLGLVEQFSSLLANVGLTLDDLYLQEPDAGLGNGGLGRLGACFLDALASNDYPAMGFSIRYEYGLFKQKIVDAWQTELPDIWLPGGSVWLTKRSDKTYNVCFDGNLYESYVNGNKKYFYENYTEVEAVPYDVMISGYDSEGVSVLRLWKSQNIRNFDVTSFSHGDYQKAMQKEVDAQLISKVLYPGDSHEEGKELRIKQQYFLVSASIQNIVRDHIKYYQDINTLAKYVSIHINDTHPALAIPELMRILIDDYLLSWSESWEITKKVFSYTNHTVMVEALESWSEELIMRKLPRIYIILKQINEFFLSEMRVFGVSNSEALELAIFKNTRVKMANLAVIASHKVNGVSVLHSNIIKGSIFKGFNRLNPEKFINVTNGIAYRRWLMQSNPLLASLLNSKITNSFYKDASKLKDLETFYNNDEVLKAIDEVKYFNKCTFAKYLSKTQDINIDPNTRFDVQIKRFHEYKRQLLNVLKIVYFITLLEENINMDFTPQTFIFGGKAASDYYIAKQIIELINHISIYINNNPIIKTKLNVVFVEDYNVSIAEKLIPATEVSEQISLAGKEASGTGNMKFMINGAITLGTLDGANVEINQRVGNDNIFIFGMTADDVNDLWKKGYFANDFHNQSPRIQKTIQRLRIGFNGKNFNHIVNYLLNNYPINDPYMCLADFDSYIEAHIIMDKTYHDKKKWNQMSLINISNAGVFSADRSIEEYAKKIWDLKKINIIK